MVMVLMGAAIIGGACTAEAQGVYVGGAVAAEAVRTSSTKSGGTTYDNGSGDALAGAIRVGTNISDRFGVELEFFRPGAIEHDGDLPYYLPALDVPVPIDRGLTATAIPGLSPSLPFFVSQRTRLRATTTSALLFVRQPLGGRVELVYLGGVGFSRVVREIDYDTRSVIIRIAPTILPAFTRATQYAAGPVVGAEVRAGMTEHAQIVAGLRVHTLGQSVVDGWMIRPSVGLAWTF
jgi:hypothetical protein